MPLVHHSLVAWQRADDLIDLAKLAALQGLLGIPALPDVPGPKR